MVLVIYCFDYDVTFSIMVNLEDAANHRHKKKLEMCFKKEAKTSNTHPYTKWVIFRNAIFAYFQIPCFHPKTWSILLAVWRLHETGFQVCVTWTLKNSEAPTINNDGIYICSVAMSISWEWCKFSFIFAVFTYLYFFPFNKPFKLSTNASVPFCSIILIRISLQHWSTSSDLVLKSDTTEKLGHSKKVSGAKNESRRGSFVPWFII